MHLRRLPLLVLGSMIVLAACGSSDSSAGSKTPSAAIGGSTGSTTSSRPTASSSTSIPRKISGGGHKKSGSTTTTSSSSPTSTSEPATVGTTPAPPPPQGGGVTFVGDSVGVDTSPYVEQDIPGVHVYAMVDRSWGEGEQILQGLAASGQLGSVVVVELGLNGPIEDSDFQQMMSILAGVKRVVFLNIRLPVDTYGPGTDWWQNQNNSVLANEIPLYHNAVLANWYAYSAGHPDWFAGDHLHLDGAGGAAMAQLIEEYA